MNYVIAGPPGSGKTTYALQNMKRGDAIIDVDYLFMALSGLSIYDKPRSLLSLVLDTRDAVLDIIQAGIANDSYIITSTGKRTEIDAMCVRFAADPVVMAVPADECKERIANDKRRDANTDWPALVDKWWADYGTDEERTMNRQERRYFTLQDLEVRADKDAPVITGYAAVFDMLSENLGGFREKIKPGAFAQSIRDGDVRALWDHDSKYVLGRNRAGTLALTEDARGLQVSITPPDTTWANDLLTTMRRGDINQMSFGFFTRADEWDKKTNPPTRTLTDVDLFDVSIVTYPAYPQTSVEARSKAAALSEDGSAAINQPAEGSASEDRRAARKHRLALMRLK